MDVLVAAIAAVVTFFLGFAARPFLMPYSRRLERTGRAVAAESPVDVHVEVRQSVIWAGYPPWMSFSYFIPGSLPEAEPPEDGRDWDFWASQHGGFDLEWTVLRVTVIAKTDTTVVMETPVVTQEVITLPDGVGVLKPAPGGADVSPRRFDVDLSAGPSPWVTFNDDDRLRSAPSFSLKAGEVEQVQLWARAQDGDLHEWRMALPFLFDGRRVLIDVDNDGSAFRTAGANNAHPIKWRPDQTWEPFSWGPRE